MSQRRALVTGASRGLGLATARHLAERGYSVTLVGRNAAGLESATQSLLGIGHRSWVHDLAKHEATEALLAKMLVETFDVVVNNAAAARFGPLTGLSANEVEQMIHLNLTAPALISRQFLLNCSSDATLVNVTSIAGTLPTPGNTIYSAAKSALQTLTECLWYEARSKGVRVLDFRPVSLQTDFHRNAGGASMANKAISVAATQAAADLVDCIEKGADFVYPLGWPARFLQLANWVLPRKFVISKMGKTAARAGYLDSKP